MRQKIVAGNWKMNGTIAETENLLRELLAGKLNNQNVKVVVCPPYTSLHVASKILNGSHIALGAQNMSEHARGAYTGEISPEMLLTAGVLYVILGHSERRQYHAETDQLVNAKVKLALQTGLIPIICVGELLSEREEGRTETVVGKQVAGTLSGLTAEALNKVVIAYEPVWAIGTGKTATPQMAQEVHAFIRDRLMAIDKTTAGKVPILYGGSVKPDNALGLHRQPDIDGSLVGGASLKADDFMAIINAV
ncbi:MAG: triose-phosphate isomerase [candidate division Zixibacteria bacterium]|nr:triose-phosphate isomerase [candidate division Zixibacteria bacterium]MDD5425752.1 triose-phosphate isomerase [candidate division Zixibacteria bacterium]